MLETFGKWFATLGLSLAAVLTGVGATSTADQLAFVDNSPSTVPIDNPLTASEFSVSLHNKITDLRNKVELDTLNTELPLVRPLLLGSRGDDVIALQNLLVRLAYLTDDLSTGYYGTSTMKAVGDFQYEFQLPRTGMVDRATLDKIFEILIVRMDLTSLYFPEEYSLLDMATSSEKLLVEAETFTCPDVVPDVVYIPSDPVVETQTVVVQPNPVKLTVAGANTAFTPKTLSVAKGTPVTIHFTVTTGTHNFVIDAYGVRVATTTSTLAHDATFTASSTGSFTYYSSIGTDKASGMTGVLTVY